MAAFLPPSQRRPSVGSRIAANIGKSLSDSFAAEKKSKSLQDILNPPKPQQQQQQQQASRDFNVAEDEQVREKFLNIVGEAEQKYEAQTGQTFTPEEIDDAWKQYTELLSQGQQAQQQQQPQEQAPQQQQQRPKYTGAQLGALAQQYPKAAEFLQKEQAEEAKIQAADKKFEQQKDLVFEKAYAGANMDFLKGVKKEAKEGKLQDLALDSMENALQGNTSWAAFKDIMADETGYEPFRTAQGAELATAMKQYLFKDIASVPASAVRNQWIEKQIFNSYPKLGRDPISNAKVVVGFKYAKNLRNKKTEVARRLERKYLDQGKNLPRGFESEVDRELTPFYVKEAKATKEKIQRLNKIEGDTVRTLRKELRKDEVLMLDADGQPQAVRRDQVEEAEQNNWLRFG